MSEYTPDRWVLVEIEHEGKKYCKVLASWYGGFAGSDSWKLSSGVESVNETKTTLVYPQSSGSTYHCFKGSYGMSGYTSGVFQSFVNELGDKIRLLSEEEAMKYHV
jgi:hypothetical protein